MKVFAVRDAAMGAFMQPFFTPAAGLATRSFSDEVNRKDSPMFAHPEDYDLFYLAEYDDVTGRINQFGEPQLLSRGKDVFRPQE